MKQDKCAGYKSWTDCGWEYDCNYEFAGDIDCGNCIFGGHGGNEDPRINPEFKGIRLLFEKIKLLFEN
jgi:hypothetical protein